MSNHPFVIQCARCKSIVGDSSNVDSYNENRNLIVLNSTINTKRLPDVIDMNMGIDVVQFNNVACSECGKTIGKYYLPPSESVNHLISRFTLSMNDVFCYEIGCSTGSPFHSDLGFLQDSNPVALETRQPSDRNHVDNEIPKTAALTSVNSEIHKIQVVLMDILHRLNCLEENSISATNGVDTDNTQLSSSKRKRN